VSLLIFWALSASELFRLEALTFFLPLTYVLKARGLTTASELTHGLWGPPAAPPAEGSRSV
jgi:hypothetical protein